MFVRCGRAAGVEWDALMLRVRVFDFDDVNLSFHLVLAREPRECEP